jgi:glucose/arabinose dehydrogenase
MVTKELHHVVMNQRGFPVRRESLMTELKQRIRDVSQGPDGLLYLTTDQEAGALLRIEPVADATAR